MVNLKKMKDCLNGVAEGQVYGIIDKVNAEELGEVMDMIKDLSEAVYYCTITESMEKQATAEKEGRPMYYTPMPIEMYDPRYGESYYPGTMYAQNGSNSSTGSTSNGGNQDGRASGGNNARGGNTRGYMDGMIRRYDDGRTSYSMYNDGGSMSYPMYHNPMEMIYRDGMMQDPRMGMMRDPREGRSGERRKMYMEGKGHKDKSKQMQELEQYMQELANDLSEMIQDASPEEKQLLQQKIATLAQKVK